ncbi:MAG: TonB-dependent receptor [Cellvibrionales bacterium]|nr:TonB-dependent receptor [Cellvibrionales bacterium]
METRMFLTAFSHRTQKTFLTAFMHCSFIATVLLSSLNIAANNVMEEVIVSADFRKNSLNSLSSSISVIDNSSIEKREAQHLEQVLALIPNINYASGASRGRYFQIRGIGERSQFVAPLNPSVGTFVDGIDFTGFAAAATLLDTKQIEVLRGSQGTRFGANALAGAINIISHAPGDINNDYIKAHIESYDGFGVQTAKGGDISNSLLYRIAIGQTKSDGFIDNKALGRDDTNKIDELSSRVKLRWLASDALTVDMTALYLDIDNGYDAFSLDANRNTLSNQPGHDRQESKALSTSIYWDLSSSADWQMLLSSSKTDAEYGFDEDWTYTSFQPEYQAFDNYFREINRKSIDMRWLSDEDGKLANSDWVIGIYHQQSTIDLIRNYTYEDLFNSSYDIKTTSVYAELQTAVNDRFEVISGVRYEKWRSDYYDSNAIKGDNDENLIGGKIALELSTGRNNLIYASLTRGYKAGGFNSEEDLPNESLRKFDTEYQWNYELGSKFTSLNNTLLQRINIFYTDRKDLQLKSSSSENNGNGGVSWIDYTDNAGKGFSYGIEWEATWQTTSTLEIIVSVGVLKTDITEHQQDDPEGFNLENRAAAHAPGYNFATAVNYSFNQRLSLHVELEGKDDYYYSDSHNFKSDNYTLLNARLNYQGADLQISLYGKNLTDEDYGVRGFSGWDADPRNGAGFDETTFEQLAAPRVIGVSVKKMF